MLGVWCLSQSLILSKLKLPEQLHASARSFWQCYDLGTRSVTSLCKEAKPNAGYRPTKSYFLTPRSWQCFSLTYAWLTVLNMLIITWTHNLVTGAFLFSFKMALWFIIHKLWIPLLAKSSEQAQAKFKATTTYKNQKKYISVIKIQYKFHFRANSNIACRQANFYTCNSSMVQMPVYNLCREMKCWKKKIHPMVYENKVSETKKARKCSNRNTKSSCDTFKGGTFWLKLFLIFVRLKERDTPHNTIHITTHQENRRKTIISLHFCCHIHYCEFLFFFFFWWALGPLVVTVYLVRISRLWWQTHFHTGCVFVDSVNKTTIYQCVNINKRTNKQNNTSRHNMLTLTQDWFSKWII